MKTNRKFVDVKLRLKPLSVEEAEDILVGLEERIRSFLVKKLRRRLDELDIIVKADYEGGELTVNVDVRVVGRVIAPLSYDEVVAEAIDEAARWLEAKLRSRLDSREEYGAREASEESS
ncbi:MAG: DUF3194 domain-containing protein [Pyrodictiaceae archaeon]